MNPLYVGIDVSSKSNVVYFMLPDGSKHCNFSVANSHTGSSQLVKRILSAMTSCSLDTVLIGLEATSVVTKHFRTLHEHVISLFPTSSKKSNVL